MDGWKLMAESMRRRQEEEAWKDFHNLQAEMQLEEQRLAAALEREQNSSTRKRIRTRRK